MRADANGFIAQGSTGTVTSGSMGHAEGWSTQAQGGQNNAAHAEGASTIASGSTAHAEGTSCTASGNASHAQGQSCVASGHYSHAGGYSSTASGQWSLAHGNTATAAASASMAVGDNVATGGGYAVATGYGSYARQRAGRAHAAGWFAAVGDAQTVDMVLRAATTNATATLLVSDGGGAAILTGTGINVLVLPASRVFQFRLRLAARRTDVQDAAAIWEWADGLILRGGSGSASLVGTPTGGKSASVNAAAWTASLSIDTSDSTNNYLRVDVQGEAAKTIRWVAHLEAVEVG